MQDHDGEPYQLISRELVLRLHFQLRIAWTAAVLDRVLVLYSPGFERTYGARDALQYAWEIACNGVDVADRRSAIARQLEASLPEIESKGYEHYALYPYFALLAEVADRDGRGSNTAIMYGGGAYLSAIVYRHGGRFVSSQFHRQLQVPYHHFAWKTFIAAEECARAGGAIYPLMFDGIPLGLDVVRPPEEAVKKMGPPPDEEARFLGLHTR